MRFLPIILVMGLTGCGSDSDVESLSPTELQTLGKIDVYKGDSPRPYTIIDTVSGRSCHASISYGITMDDAVAIQAMKMIAAQAGADAVINSVCQARPDTGWFDNCWDSVVCAGTAIHYKR